MDRRRFLKYLGSSAAIAGTALGINYLATRKWLLPPHEKLSPWETRSSLPFGIADAPAASYDRGFFIFGGYSRSVDDAKNSVLEFDGHSWRSKSSMHLPRWGAAATIIDDHAYVFGGYPNPIAERYDIENDRWEMLSPMPVPIQGQGLMVAKIGGKIYIFFRSATFEYDSVTDQYSRRLDAPLPRTWATCAYVKVESEDRIYIIGGHDANIGDGTNLNFYYLPTSDRWSEPQSPAPYSAYGVTRDNPVWMGLIHYGFGHKNPDQFFKDMYTFNPATCKWSKLATASHKRDGVACAMLDETFYVVGGRNQPTSQFGITYCEALSLSDEA